MGTIANFLSNIFKGNKPPSNKLETISFMSLLNSPEAKAELNSTYTSAVNAHASFLSKIQPAVRYKSDDSMNKAYMTRILSLQPNRLMNAPRFWNSMARSYFANNLAIAWLVWDYTQPGIPLTEIWPIDIIDSGLVLAVNPADGRLYGKFRFNSSVIYADSADLLIIQRDASISDLLAGRSKAIDADLKVIAAAYETAERAVIESRYIRFLAKTGTQISGTNQKQYREQLEELINEAKGGIVPIPAGTDLVPVTSKGQWLPDADVEGYKDDIYRYLGTNKKIVDGSFNEDEYQSYYERSLEPFCVQAAAEMTIKLLTKSEIEHGNKIEVSTDPLQTASLKTRISIATAMEGLPVIVPNDVLSLLHQPTYSGGEVPQASLNYVNKEKQDQYQGVGGTPKGGTDNGSNK